MATCQQIINMATPVRSERRRQFQPPYYTVFIYVCPTCKAEHTLRANTFRGKRAVVGTGAILCGREVK
jgi:hypothetical protein